MSFIINPYVWGASNTTRTQAFVDASGLSDSTIIDALNVFDQALIDNSLESKIQCFYPFVGGTASLHKWNFMDARDLDAAFRLTFSGGITHSATGALPNGINGWAQTYYQMNVDASQNDISFGFYSGIDVNSGIYDMGTYTGTNYTVIRPRFGGNGVRVIVNNSSADILDIANADARGFWMANRTSSTEFKIYKNGSEFGQKTSNSVALSALTMYLFAVNGGGASSAYADREHRGTFIGKGLTGGEQTTLYNMIQTFNTSLSRNV